MTPEPEPKAITARALGLIGCEVCGHLNRAPETTFVRCRRCQAPLHARKPDSLARTSAYLISAAILYIPANLYPVLETHTLGHDERDTVMQGVLALWASGSWLLAALVFFASMVVPMMKLLALALLVITVKRRSDWRLLERARLFRLIEFIGRWSMLDIYVVSILVALVHLRGLASMEAGEGAVAFASVVVLTMLSARSFDPRLMWDVLEQERSR